MKNKRIYVVLFIFLVFLFLNVNKSQAHIPSFEVINSKLGDNGWILYQGKDDNYYIACGNYGIHYAQPVSWDKCYVQKCGDSFRFSTTSSGIDNYYGTTIYQVDNNYNLTKVASYSWEGSSYSVANVIDCRLGHDIQTSEGKSTYLSISGFNNDIADPFYQPPLTLVMKQEIKNKATIQEILGVLPLIIVVMVSFLGLRKGLTTLLNLVKTA